MRHALVTALFLSHAAHAAGPDIQVSQIVAGQPVRITVAHNLPEGTVIHWAVSTTGPGTGPCIPAAGGDCFDIDAPAYFGSATISGGWASVSQTAPADIATLAIYGVHFQAVAALPSGAWVFSPVFHQDVATVLCPAGFWPVCGVDGVTYGSDCRLHTLGMVLDHVGACEIVCPADALICPDGTVLSREAPDCEFPACPPITSCTADVFDCGGGVFVERVPPLCEFEACPIACTADVMACPDGSFVGRVPPLCEFEPCP